ILPICHSTEIRAAKLRAARCRGWKKSNLHPEGKLKKLTFGRAGYMSVSGDQTVIVKGATQVKSSRLRPWSLRLRSTATDNRSACNPTSGVTQPTSRWVTLRKSLG